MRGYNRRFNKLETRNEVKNELCPYWWEYYDDVNEFRYYEDPWGYRIIDDNTGEYFDCQAYSWNPTASERMWNQLEKGKIYQVEARGLKNDYNIRTISDIK